MAITWEALKGLMQAAMDAADIDLNVDRTPQMEWAMRTFAQHTPYQGTAQFTIAAARETQEMPDDFLDPRGVFFTHADLQGWTPCLGLSKGALGNAYSAAQGSEFTSKGWWLWPADTMNFLNMVGTVDVYYYAYYPALTDDPEQIIPIPNWSVHPLIWLSLVYAKIPDSVSTSDLARWSETSGERRYNPILEQISYFQKQYEWELANHPAVERELIIPGESYGR